MSAICGLPLQDWYRLLRLRSASSRTFQASLLTTTETSDPTFRPWATRLRRESSQRRRSARLTFANGSTSWPTARSHETGDYQYDQGNHDNPRATLSGAIQSWATPTPRDHKDGTPSNVPINGLLGRQVWDASLWQTPAVSNRGTHNSGDMKHSYDLLPNQVKAWATPSAMDGGTGPQDAANRAGGPSLPAQVMQEDGATGSPVGRVLNPAFVEMLMGWPPGLTDYASSETASSRWWPLMRGVLCRLGWE